LHSRHTAPVELVHRACAFSIHGNVDKARHKKYAEPHVQPFVLWFVEHGSKLCGTLVEDIRFLATRYVCHPNDLR
jgi:hypothetical protein